MEGDTAVDQPTAVKVHTWGKPASSPWGKPTVETPCSLEDVMSEQLASELQEEENQSLDTHLSDAAVGGEVEPEIQELIEAAGQDTDTGSDVALARMLQMQFDQEYNQFLSAKEKQVNGTNKVTISFENYRSAHPGYRDEESDDEQCEVVEEKTAWERDPVPQMNAKGYCGRGKNITTKHDAVICGRKNASKLLEFPPGFVSGDGEGMDMQLPNNVYNNLKRHCGAETKRSHKLHEKKEHSTAEQAMDPRTRLMLYKMVNNGTLESISGSISTGKESVVFHAYGGQIKDQPLPTEVAIKVYKTTLNEFKNREIYVHGDHRFSKDDYKKQNPRKIIAMWSAKETANLNRMRKFRMLCPEVQVCKQHVLIMTFIGEDRKPAPKLKEARMSAADYEDAYQQVIRACKTMYRDCGLVHADLSEYNMLWHRDQVWIIDVSQAVDITHPRALEFLYRDCTNVANFFKKSGVHNVLPAEAMFNKVTQLDISGTGADFLSQVQRYAKEKNEELLAHQCSHKVYPFDFFFEKSQQERSNFNTLQISDTETDDIDDDDDDDDDSDGYVNDECLGDNDNCNLELNKNSSTSGDGSKSNDGQMKNDSSQQAQGGNTGTAS